MGIPNRRAGWSRLHRTALATVVAGTVVGAVLAIAASWPARVGIAVAVITGWAALLLAWRELVGTRLEAHEHLMQSTQRAYEVLVAERATTDKVVTLLRDRSLSLTASLVELRGDLAARQAELAERRMEISALRGDNQALRFDVEALVERVNVLSSQVEAAADADGAEILSLPRRPMKHQRALWSDGEVWASHEMPSIAELVRSDSGSATPVEALRQA